MRSDFDGHRDVWGPLLAMQLRTWSETVFKPASLLRQIGLFRPSVIGEPPPDYRFIGGGATISRNYPGLNLLDKLPESYERLKQFDVVAAEYRSIVEPFSSAIFQEVLNLLSPHLVSHARLLDVGCGPGTEVMQLAGEVPEGEVIGVDLSTEMIKKASRNCHQARLSNTAFFQCDTHNLPNEWDESFDAALCMLSFHFFQDAETVLKEFLRILSPGGMALIADPGSEWFNTISTPLLELANPAFVKYRTGKEFIELLDRTGFSNSYWVEVLPGMGVAVARK